MYLAVDGVRADVECEDFKGVGMHEKRVLLRIVDGDGTLGGHCIACRVIVFTVVACHHVLVDGIVVHHVPIGIVGAIGGIMVDTVANEDASLVADDGAAEELRLLCLGVVETVLAINVAGARRDVRWSYDMRHRCLRVVK